MPSVFGNDWLIVVKGPGIRSLLAATLLLWVEMQILVLWCLCSVCIYLYSSL